MTNQAKPATNKLPNVQKAAIKLSMEPRLDLGWNSAKYDQMTGPLPPKLIKGKKIFKSLLYYASSSHTLKGVSLLQGELKWDSRVGFQGA